MPLSGLDPAGCSTLPNVRAVAKGAKPNGQAAGKHQERAVALTVSTEAKRPRSVCGSVPIAALHGGGHQSLDEKCKLTLSCVGSAVWALHPGQVRARKWSSDLVGRLCVSSIPLQLCQVLKPVNHSRSPVGWLSNIG
jgi:hypothetical protein